MTGIPAPGRALSKTFVKTGRWPVNLLPGPKLLAPGLWLYSSFATEAGGGSPAAVVVSPERLDTALAQAVATDLSAPTTGFVVLDESPAVGTATMRFFTPAREIGFCGHVAIAAATALAELRLWSWGQEVAIRAGGTDIPLRLRDGRVEIELHSRGHTPTEVSADDIAAALGGDAFRSDLPPEAGQTMLRHLIIAATDTAALGGLTIDKMRISGLAALAGVDTVCVWAPAPGRARFRMRDLCAGIGDPEEAASGTTAAALAFYLARHGQLTGPELVIEQGVEMGRPSRIEVTVGPQGSARVRGVARKISAGPLLVPVSRPGNENRRLGSAAQDALVTLSPDMKRVVFEQQLGYAATVGPDGTPNLSPKGTTTVWDDQHLAFADICSPSTVRNLRANPWIEVNVVDPVVRKGYRFKGRAEVYDGGEIYAAGLRLFAEQGVDASPGRIKTLVLIHVEYAAALISPAYDSGASEQQIAGKWERHQAELTQLRRDRAAH